MNPRQLATDTLAKLDVSDLRKVEIAGAGFLNFRLKPVPRSRKRSKPPRAANICFLKNAARRKPSSLISVRRTSPSRCTWATSAPPILGDALARTLRLLGHRVITDNHIGDWGTQFGMLLVGWKKHLDRARSKRSHRRMERLYKLINAAGESDENGPGRSRQELVKLQGGDAENLKIWREMIALSQKQFDEIYSRLGVKFDHTLGESFYNPR
jgi:arginyl-tRNA synthetase